MSDTDNQRIVAVGELNTASSDDNGLPLLGILKPDGTPWMREAGVTAQILKAYRMTPDAVVAWAALRRTHEDAFTEEAIVHFIHHYRSTGDSLNADHLLAILIQRCAEPLAHRFRGMDPVVAEQATDRVLDTLHRILNGSDSRTGKYMEIKFGQVFRARIIDAWRHFEAANTYHAQTISLSDVPESMETSMVPVGRRGTLRVDELAELRDACRVILETDRNDQRIGKSYILNYYGGTSKSDIAKQYHVSTVTIARWFKMVEQRLALWREGTL